MLGVMMVLEGNLATVTRIKTAVKQKPPIPIILFEGTGGFTEIMIYAKRYHFYFNLLLKNITMKNVILFDNRNFLAVKLISRNETKVVSNTKKKTTFNVKEANWIKLRALIAFIYS